MASRVTRDPHNLYRDFTIHSGNETSHWTVENVNHVWNLS